MIMAYFLSVINSTVVSSKQHKHSATLLSVLVLRGSKLKLGGHDFAFLSEKRTILVVHIITSSP